MTVKEFLSQAEYLDRLIDSELEQLEQLRSVSCSSKSIAAASKNGSTVSVIEKTVEKICLAEEEINRHIDGYADTKREIARLVNSLSDLQQRYVQEQHYLLFKPWERIAEESYMSLRNVQYIHKKAISTLEERYGEKLSLVCAPCLAAYA